ncbi:MAG: hypothetical protein QM765_31670 [Myxococcales bacterium]
MKPQVRRILWMLVVASLGLSGLSACSFQSLFGAGAGLGFAGFVTAILLLLGTATTTTGCHPCLSILVSDDVGPCLSPPRPDAGAPDVGPCLDVMPPDADLGPCLSPPIDPDAGLGACLSQPPPSDASVDATLPATPDSALASADREQVLQKLQDRLPEDVQERLKIKKV